MSEVSFDCVENKITLPIIFVIGLLTFVSIYFISISQGRTPLASLFYALVIALIVIGLPSWFFKKPAIR